MSTTTPNYSFVKPELTDPANIEAFNENWDKIDESLGKHDSHISNKINPHNVTKAQVGLGNVDNISDADKPVSTAQAEAIADAKKAGTDAQNTIATHGNNKNNPHEVTKSQVGLGNVPNVSTNNQTPTYTASTSLTTLTSGEKLSAAFAKIAKAITDLISHLANKSNPHAVTAAQVGAAKTDHTHSASDIDSGTLGSARLPTVPVSKGGTGKTSVTSGSFLIGNGTGAMTEKTNSEVRTAINAVNKSGDTMTGALTIENNNPNLYLKDTDNGGSTRLNKNTSSTADYGSYFADLNAEGKRDAFIVRRVAGLENKLALSVEQDDGTYSTYYIYGEHNKPGSEDLGFIPIGNDRKDIPESSNLNDEDFLKVGAWRCTTTSKAGTLTNCPVAMAFTLDIMAGTGYHNQVTSTAGYIIQRITTQVGEVYFRRIYQGSSGRVIDDWSQVISTHSKPNRTYSGNGSTTTRTINTTGLGNLLMVQSDKGTCLVTPRGAFVITNSTSGTSATTQWFTSATIYYADGVLYIAGNSEYFNGSGVTYDYYCI